MPQSLALYFELSAEQNLRIFGELHGLRGATLKSRVDEALAAVRLSLGATTTQDDVAYVLRELPPLLAPLLQEDLLAAS